ncbi:MAG: DUF1016 domain-containing protein [Chitinophagaceae bacterium]|nr:MAG: DUF1016 domain-containing protein [Chitinophagaceae bacterium]
MQIKKTFIAEIKNILLNARRQTYAIANREMLAAYWNVGKRITEEEQEGKKRAAYGVFLLRELATHLTDTLGKGFDERELRRMRQFFQYFPTWDSVRPELTWTHYRFILRVKDLDARSYYVMEAITGNWSTRILERNVSSQYYHRLLPKKENSQTLNKPGNPVLSEPRDLIKDPYFLEFLGITTHDDFSENELEKAIINKLQQFLLELGKGFAFVSRQYHIRTETKEFYIDLVFYNYLLKCFVLVDLKVTELTHQDIGQMDMYIRLFENLKKIPGDNPTVGIILCTDKDETIVKYSVLQESKQLFASKYRLYLPDEKEIIDEINAERNRLHL